MYRVLLREVKEGRLKWWDNCYYASKLKKNKIIVWKSPDDKKAKNYKIVAWKWEGPMRSITKNAKFEKYKEVADKFLLSLNPKEKKYLDNIINDRILMSNKVYERHSTD